MQGPFYEQMGTYAVYIDGNRYWVNPDTNCAVDSNETAETGEFKEISEELEKELLMFVRAYLKKHPKKTKMPNTVYEIPTLEGDFIVSDSLIRLIPTLADEIWEKKGKAESDESEFQVTKLEGMVCMCKDRYGDFHMFSDDVLELFPDIGKRIAEAEYSF